MRAFLTGMVMLFAIVPAAAGVTLQGVLTEKLIGDYQLDRNYVDISLARSAIGITDLTGYEVRAYPLTQADPRGRFPMRVEIFKDGILIEKNAVSLDIRVSADLLVPVRNIGRHELLEPDMFTLKRFDITKQNERMLSDFDYLAGCRARQNMSAGMYVPLSRIERIPDIENGSPIAIVGSSSLFEIKVKGVAMQNGNIGDRIRVKNIDSRKILVGRVIGPGTVEIAL